MIPCCVFCSHVRPCHTTKQAFTQGQMTLKVIFEHFRFEELLLFKKNEEEEMIIWAQWSWRPHSPTDCQCCPDIKVQLRIHKYIRKHVTVVVKFELLTRY